MKMQHYFISSFVIVLLVIAPLGSAEPTDATTSPSGETEGNSSPLASVEWSTSHTIGSTGMPVATSQSETNTAGAVTSPFPSVTTTTTNSTILSPSSSSASLSPNTSTASPATSPAGSTSTTNATTQSTTPVTVTQAPVTAAPGRKFDGLSFLGGMILVAGLVALGYLVVRYLRRSNRLPYGTLH